MLSKLRQELKRVGAKDVRVSMDDEFEPSVGTLLKVETGDTYWHMFPEGFGQILAELSDGAGSDAVAQAIETKGLPVWHGPSPKKSRE